MLSILLLCLIYGAVGIIAHRFLPIHNRLERMLMSFVFGVCAFPLLGIVLSSFNALYLNGLVSASLGFILFYHILPSKEFKLPAISINESIVVLLALALFGVFCLGGFSVPWLEDGDPNGHALAASYIAHYHTYSKPADMFVARYMEPYPVGFQMWMGLLSQFNGNVVWTLRTFNYIFISLGIIVFFYLVRALSDNDNLALYSAFILTILPAFSTRFIFAQGLAITQILMVMYIVAVAIKANKGYWLGGIVLGALFITQTTSSAIMGGFLVIWVVLDSFINRKLNIGLVSVMLLGAIIGGAWWFYEFSKYGFDKVKTQMGLDIMSKGMVGFGDPTKRLYTLGDFIFSPEQNSIDNMTGVGVAAWLLMLLGVVYCLKERKTWQSLVICWLAFGILGIFSDYLPVTLVPSRFWAYAAIPIAVVSGVGMFHLMKKDLAMVAFIAVIILLATSAYPKIVVNSQPWGSARLYTEGDYATQAYMMANSTRGAKAFDACMYERVWSMNLWDDPLDREAIIFKNVLVNVSKYGWDSNDWLKLHANGGSRVFDSSVSEVHDFLKAKGYKYLLVNTKCVNNGVYDYVYSNRIKEFDGSDKFGVFFKYDMERVYEIR